MTSSQDDTEIARDARWEWRLVYKAVIAIAVTVAVIVIREHLL